MLLAAALAIGCSAFQRQRNDCSNCVVAGAIVMSCFEHAHASKITEMFILTVTDVAPNAHGDGRFPTGRFGQESAELLARFLWIPGRGTQRGNDYVGGRGPAWE
jgi:hypothetical protein